MMRRSQRNALIVLCLLLAGVAAWAFLNQPVWLPAASQWAGKTWRGLSRPDAPASATAPSKSRAGDAAPERRPRKCTGANGEVTYTDQACPAGMQEQWFDGASGAVVESVPPERPAR